MAIIVDHGRKSEARKKALRQAISTFAEDFTNNKSEAKSKKREVANPADLKPMKKKKRNTDSKAPRTDTLKGNMFDDLMNNLF